MKQLLTVILIIIGSLTNAQSYKKDSLETLGLAYGHQAYKSPIFIDFEDMLQEKNYRKIVRKLTSKSPSTQFLATVICDSLRNTGVIKLSVKEEKLIQSNKKSQSQVLIRYGCVCREVVSLKMLYKKENYCLFINSFEEWIVKVLP